MSESARHSRSAFLTNNLPGDFLVPFASLQKELAAAAAKSLFSFRGCSACGRATFQRRKVAASSQSPLCSGHPGLGIPHAAPLLLLSNHEPLRWVHGWGPIAGLRARTQESCAVSSSIPSGAVPSGMVSMLTHCRSAQLTKQVLLQDAMRLSGATYTVGGDRRAGEDTRPYIQ